MTDTERLSVSAAMILEEAMSWIGTPYKHQTCCKGAGCDCLGLIRGVYGAFWSILETPPAYNPDWADADGEETLANAAGRYLQPVDAGVRQPAHVLLFRYRKGFPAKHAGILFDDSRFIHAQAGACVSLVSFSPWWQRHLCGVYAFPSFRPNDVAGKGASCPLLF